MWSTGMEGRTEGLRLHVYRITCEGRPHFRLMFNNIRADVIDEAGLRKRMAEIYHER
jgi:hypothetical protein